MVRITGLVVVLVASALVAGAVGAVYAGGSFEAPRADSTYGDDLSGGDTGPDDGTTTPDDVSAPTGSGEAALVDFVATGSTCGSDDRGGSTSVGPAGDMTMVTINRSVTLPSAGYRLEASDLHQTGPHNYTLNVTSVETDKPAVQCVASARYVAHVQLPETGDEPYTLTVYEDGEQAMTVWNRDGASGGSASASAGVSGSSSGSDAGNGSTSSSGSDAGNGSTASTGA